VGEKRPRRAEGGRMWRDGGGAGAARRAAGQDGGERAHFFL